MSETFRDYQLQVELVSLWKSKKTGVLKIESGGFEETLYLQNGAVVFATSNDPSGKLTQVLIDQGKFTQEQYEAVEGNFDEDVSTGRNLINMGLITQQELAQGGRAQVYHVFANCMRAENGTFKFEEGDLPNGVVNLPPKLPDAFFKTVLASQDKAWISQQFGADLAFVCEKSDGVTIDFNKVEVGDFAEEIYELIDGEADFNHLAFEVDVDDFILLKFLYALKLLGYIQVVENEKEDPFAADADEVRDELTQALAQSEELDMLGGVSLDETVQLPSVQNMVEEKGSFDATMEISKEMLNQAEPALAQGNPWDEPGEGEPDYFEEAVADDPVDLEEEAGLDDLGDMSSQILEDELTKMEAPAKLAGVIMPDPIEEIEEEAPPVDRRRRAMILSSVAMFFLSGYLFLAQPHVALFSRFLPERETTLREEIEAVENGTREEVAPVENGTNGDAMAEVNPKGEADSEEPVVNLEDSPELLTGNESENTTLEAAAETEPAEKQQQPATVTREKEPDVELVQGTTNPEEKKPAFVSPMAQGGYPTRPTPAVRTLGKTERERQGNGEAPPKRVATGTGKQPGKEVLSTTKPVQATSPTEFLGAGNFPAAAVGFKKRYQGSDKYTLSLFLSCEDESLLTAIRETGGNAKLFILPKTHQGKSCYWTCWGSFDTYRQAIGAIDSLPATLRARQSVFEVKPLNVLFH